MDSSLSNERSIYRAVWHTPPLRTLELLLKYLRCLIVLLYFSLGLDEATITREENASKTYLVCLREHLSRTVQTQFHMWSRRSSADHGSWPVILAIAPRGIVHETLI